MTEGGGANGVVGFLDERLTVSALSLPFTHKLAAFPIVGHYIFPSIVYTRFCLCLPTRSGHSWLRMPTCGTNLSVWAIAR